MRTALAAACASLIALLLAPAAAVAGGRIERIDGWRSQVLGNSRSIFVYLPESYDAAAAQGRRYPVVYAQDGQNLFDRNAFFGGWQADAALDSGIAGGRIAPLILVGTANTPDRIGEYTPTPDPRYGGGRADRYLDFIERELKPWVDGRYRTLADARNTGILGSSLGGLVSFHAGWTRPHVFGNVGAMSPSLWWDGERLLRQVQAFGGTRPAARFFVDSGGSADGADACARLRDALAALGYRFDADLFHWVEWGHQHNEIAWRERLPRVLASLFPAGGVGAPAPAPTPTPAPAPPVPAPARASTVIRVHFDVGYGRYLSVRGDAPGWNRWQRALPLRWSPGNIWVLETTDIPRGASFRFKVLVGDRLYEPGPDRTGVGGATTDLRPRF